MTKFGTMQDQSVSTNSTAWWRTSAGLPNCRKPTQTTASGPPQSPCGQTPPSKIAILWRYPVTAVSRVWRTKTHGLRHHNFSSAAMSFLEVWTPKITFIWQSDKRPHPNSRTQRDDNGNVKQVSWIALQQLHGTTSTCARHFGLRFQPGTLTWVFYFYLDLSCKSSTHFWHESAFEMHSLRA